MARRIRALRHTPCQLSGSLPLALEAGLGSAHTLNRKLLWVQSSFTVLTIVAFGTLTLALHTELLRGDRAALGLACFIGTYWTARILVDAFYFSHEDWPKGWELVVGHILLTCLFVALACIYLGLFAWQVWSKAGS